MPTIEELFRSKKLSSGITAEQQYAVRNSKDNELTSAAGLMGLPFKAATAIRRKISTTGTETLIEQETTGLRIISKLSSPIIYGTKIGRFTLQQSDDVEEMKSAKNVSAGNGGLLGGLVNSVRGEINSVKSILGVPQNITPTKIYLNKTKFNTDNVFVSDTMSALADIKKIGGGSILGKLLAKGIGSGGTINQLGSSIPGAAAEAGKKALKNLLLGSGNVGQINLANNLGVPNLIYRKDKHGKITNDWLFTSFSHQSNNGPNNEQSNNYSQTIKFGDDVEVFDRNDLSTKYSMISDGANFVEKNYIEIFQNEPISIQPFGGGASILVGGRYTKRNKTRFDKISLESKLGLTTNKTNDKGEIIQNGVGNYLDALNKKLPYKEDKDIDGMDFVTLKFYSVAKGAYVNFRATITGLTETYAPTWDSQKFIGNPFSFHTYNGIERSIQFNFKIYSLSVDEHTAAWERLNFLASLVYPQEYIGSNAVVPPFLKFTLGDMFKNAECFIDSLIYTIDDNNVWEVGEYAMNYKLPRIIDVGITLKLVESKSNTFEKNLYGFNSVYGKELSENSSPKEIISAKEEAEATAAKAKEARDKAAAKKAAAEKAAAAKPKVETKPFTNGSGPLALPNTSAPNGLNDVSKYLFKGNKF
jgi:hypothetical protein